jgi:pimeloyl-ACP methyl ester carboxylesterase
VSKVEADAGHGLSIKLREGAYAWFDRWLAERKEPREEEIKVTPRPAKELLVCADGQVNVTYKSRPLLPLVAEEFRRKKEKPPRVALKDLLGMDPDRADFHLTKTDAVGKSENPHVICVNGNEAAGWESEDAFVTALGKAGFGVTVVDPRGVGKLRPAGLEVKGHLYADPLCGVEENIAYNAFLVGKNLVGMRVADVLKAVAKVQGDTKATKVVLCGRRDSALVACFAAAVDPSIHAVAVEEMPLSFWPLFEPEGRAINASDDHVCPPYVKSLFLPESRRLATPDTRRAVVWPDVRWRAEFPRHDPRRRSTAPDSRQRTPCFLEAPSSGVAVRRQGPRSPRQYGPRRTRLPKTWRRPIHCRPPKSKKSFTCRPASKSSFSPASRRSISRST